MDCSNLDSLSLSLWSILRGFCFNLGRGMGLDGMGISEKLIKAIIEKDFVARDYINFDGRDIWLKLDIRLYRSFIFIFTLLEFLIFEEIINSRSTGKKIDLGLRISNFDRSFDFYWKVKVVFLESQVFDFYRGGKIRVLVYHYSSFGRSFNPDFPVYRLKKGKSGILMDRESCARRDNDKSQGRVIHKRS